MQSHYTQFTRAQFIKISILICALGDLAIGGSLYYLFTDVEYFHHQFQLTLKVLGESGINPDDLPPHFMTELYEVMRRTLITMLVLVYGAHSLAYFAFYKERPSAYFYVKTMAWLGPLFCLILAWGRVSFSMFFAYFYIQALAYLWVAMGMRFFLSPKKNLG